MKITVYINICVDWSEGSANCHCQPSGVKIAAKISDMEFRLELFSRQSWL